MSKSSAFAVLDSNCHKIGKMDLRFRSITRASDADDPADAVEEGSEAGLKTGYVPIDQITREMISPRFLADVSADDVDDYDFGEEASDYGFDPLDQLIAREAEGSNVFKQQEEEQSEATDRNNAFEFCDHTDHSVPTARDELLNINGSRTFESNSRKRFEESVAKQNGAEISSEVVRDSHGKRFGAFEQLFSGAMKVARNTNEWARTKVKPSDNRRETIRRAEVSVDLLFFDSELGRTYAFYDLVAKPRRSR